MCRLAVATSPLHRTGYCLQELRLHQDAIRQDLLLQLRSAAWAFGPGLNLTLARTPVAC